MANSILIAQLAEKRLSIAVSAITSYLRSTYAKGVVAVQHDYAATSHDGKPIGTYAGRIISDPGKQNGIYWDAGPGDPASPAGELLAKASQEGYGTSGPHTPYHGYFYRMLNNPGGFEFIAYPADYRVSGVMTFVVTQDGIIRQKDLGPNSGEIVSRIGQYKIDDTWQEAN